MNSALPTADGHTGRRHTVRSIVVWTAATAVVLAIFDALSARSELARTGWLAHNGDRFARPPIYGQFVPQLTRWILPVIAIAAVACGLAWLAGRGGVSPVVFVAAAALMFTGFAVAVAFVAGDRAEATVGMAGDSDAAPVGRLGVRTFVRSYPDLIGDDVTSIHSLTHPPGRPILAWALRKAFDDPLSRSVAVAAFSSLVLVPAYLLTRELHGDRAARYAVVLIATAPGPVMFAFASYESIEVVFLVAAGWLIVRASREGARATPAIAGGALLGFAAILTYSAGLVAASLALYALATRPLRAGRTLLFAAAGGLAALVVLRVAAGFDPAATAAATRRFFTGLTPCPPSPPAGFGPCYLARPYGYWIAGAPAGWLTFAGVPLAALSLRELARGQRFLLAVVIPPAVLYALPRSVTGLFPGELERTVLYGFAFAAVASAGALGRVTSPRVRPLVTSLAAFAALQTIVIEVLYRTGW